jgi:hypothetical protein
MKPEVSGLRKISKNDKPLSKFFKKKKKEKTQVAESRMKDGASLQIL